MMNPPPAAPSSLEVVPSRSSSLRRTANFPSVGSKRSRPRHNAVSGAANSEGPRRKRRRLSLANPAQSSIDSFAAAAVTNPRHRRRPTTTRPKGQTRRKRPKKNPKKILVSSRNLSRRRRRRRRTRQQRRRRGLIVLKRGVVTDAPLDWTLKQSIRITVSVGGAEGGTGAADVGRQAPSSVVAPARTPQRTSLFASLRPWGLSNSSVGAAACFGFAQQSVGVSTGEGETIPSSSSSQFRSFDFVRSLFGSLHHFVFPLAYGDAPTTDRARPKKSARVQVPVRKTLWAETFVGLMSQFAAGRCPYFYLQSSSEETDGWCALFVTGTGKVTPRAILSFGQLRRRFVGELRNEGIGNLPDSRSKYVRIDGRLEVQRFANFMLRFVTSDATDSSSARECVILSPSPFLNGTLVNSVSSLKTVMTDEQEQLVLEGTFLPHAIRSICDALSNSALPFEAQFGSVVTITRCLNVPPREDEPLEGGDVPAGTPGLSGFSLLSQLHGMFRYLLDASPIQASVLHKCLEMVSRERDGVFRVRIDRHKYL